MLKKPKRYEGHNLLSAKRRLVLRKISTWRRKCKGDFLSGHQRPYFFTVWRSVWRICLWILGLKELFSGNGHVPLNRVLFGGS